MWKSEVIDRFSITYVNLFFNCQIPDSLRINKEIAVEKEERLRE